MSKKILKQKAVNFKTTAQK